RFSHSASASMCAALALADLSVRRGDYAVAADWLGDATRLASTLRDEPGRLAAMLSQAHLLRLQGETAEAVSLYDTTAGRARELGRPATEIAALAGAVLLLTSIGDGGARWERVSELLAGARPDWWFPGRELVDAVSVRVTLAAGHISVAFELFGQAVSAIGPR